MTQLNPFLAFLAAASLSGAAAAVAAKPKLAAHVGDRREADVPAQRDDVVPYAKGSRPFAGWGLPWYDAPYRQTMLNVGEAYYVIQMGVGGANLSAIMDTGSFDMVVFSESCENCGVAARYKPSLRGHQGDATGGLTKLSYGSGDLFTVASSDVVQLGPWQLNGYQFQEVMDAEMPLLFQADFHVILGVGPPLFGANLQSGGVIWTRVLHDRRMHRKRIPSVLESLHIQTFSVCLGKEAGSDGVFVWNDNVHVRKSEMFLSLPVIGDVTWGVELTGARLAHPDNQKFTADLGCKGGCAALLDSGTSLLTVPSHTAHLLAEAVASLDDKCNDIHLLPTLVFNLGGMEITMPPETYMGRTIDDDFSMDDFTAPKPDNNGTNSTDSNCELLVMETDIVTQAGPMWILGMPFFRRYYTTFNIGNSRLDRSVFIAEAGDECMPTKDGPASLFRESEAQAPAKPTLLRVSKAKLRKPSILGKVNGGNFLHI